MKEEDLKVVIDTARKNLKESEMLTPTFFIGNDDGLNIVGAVFTNEMEKLKTAMLIKKMSRETKATFILFICESWTLSQEDAKEYYENRQNYSQVSDHPGAFDAVLISLETLSGTKMGRAKILPGREMGEINWIEAKGSEMEGIFVNLLDR